MQPLQICICPTIRIDRESWCLPYAGFLYQKVTRTQTGGHCNLENESAQWANSVNRNIEDFQIRHCNTESPTGFSIPKCKYFLNKTYPIHHEKKITIVRVVPGEILDADQSFKLNCILYHLQEINISFFLLCTSISVTNKKKIKPNSQIKSHSILL